MKVYEFYEVRVNGVPVAEPLRYLEQAITSAFIRCEEISYPTVIICGGDHLDVRLTPNSLGEYDEFITDSVGLFECQYLAGDPVTFELRLLLNPYETEW